MVFSATPPTSPILPFWSMVPVAAITWPPVSLPLVILSMMPSVMATPAEGPPIWGVLMVTSTGKCQSCWVWDRTPR